MTNPVKKVVLISASPKVRQNKALSEYLTLLEKDTFTADGITVECINVKSCATGNTGPQAFKSILTADFIVINFPLYVYCLPGLLMRFLQDYYKYYLEHKNNCREQKVFAVANCGFPEPVISDDAIGVIKSFSAKIGAQFCFGVSIGAGGLIMGMKDKPHTQKAQGCIAEAFSLIKTHILHGSSGPQENIYIEPGLPKEQVLAIIDDVWMRAAQHSGLGKQSLFKKVYL